MIDRCIGRCRDVIHFYTPNPDKPEITNYKHQINVINLRIGVTFVGAAFQPRLAITALERLLFVAGKPLPRKVGVKLMTLSTKLQYRNLK
jgi:hypothetical protein